MPTEKITFRLPAATLTRFEELYEELRVEEWTNRKRKLKKVAFAGHVFTYGLDAKKLREAIAAA